MAIKKASNRKRGRQLRVQRFVSQRQSAYLNLVTTERDIENAKWEYQEGNWKECIRNIREGIKQLQSAEAKLANDKVSDAPDSAAPNRK